MTEKVILVQKFGGTSVSTAERRMQVVEHVQRARGEGYQVAIVVSAMGRWNDPYATRISQGSCSSALGRGHSEPIPVPTGLEKKVTKCLRLNIIY